MNSIRFLFAALATLVVPALARAQQSFPFFSSAATAYEPQVSVLNTGVILDAQAVVSADRKYVTLNMQPSNSALIALQSYTFVSGTPGMTGFVGGAGITNVQTTNSTPPNPIRPLPRGSVANPAGGANSHAVRGGQASPPVAPVSARVPMNPLDLEGMVLVSRN